MIIGGIRGLEAIIGKVTREGLRGRGRLKLRLTTPHVPVVRSKLTIANLQ